MESNPIYKERLLLLADFLEKLSPERFDYRSWVGDDWFAGDDSSCGTKGCAFGWAATMPEFRALGLRIDPARGIPSLKGMSVTHSGYELFGLNLDEFYELFMPGSVQNPLVGKSSPREVAQHIRDFIDNS